MSTTSTMHHTAPARRAASLKLSPVAVTGGRRTPFVRSFAELAGVPADRLGQMAVNGLLGESPLVTDDIDEVVFGNVAGPADASNIARVIALRSGIPHDRIAHTVNRNCGSGMEALLSGWQALAAGRSDVVIAGGTESMSQVPLLWDRRMGSVFLQLRKAKSLRRKLAVAMQIRPDWFRPVPALELGLNDPVCGLSMGQTAERLARDFGITREQQDAFALESHQRAAAARDRGFLAGELLPLFPPAAENREKDDPLYGLKVAVEQDLTIRDDQTAERLARLRPVFQRENGTVTAGNSCPVTDGAVALGLMLPEVAAERGIEPLGRITAYAIAGCDPARMGLGPVYAMHRLFEQTGLTLSDFDLVEINEAFAAQVLACVEALDCGSFCREELGRDEPIGRIARDRLNVNGGAIALGHPVGATGARLVLTLLRALRERNLRRGLAALCIGGGQGMAVVVETEAANGGSN